MGVSCFVMHYTHQSFLTYFFPKDLYDSGYIPTTDRLIHELGMIEIEWFVISFCLVLYVICWAYINVNDFVHFNRDPLKHPFLSFIFFKDSMTQLSKAIADEFPQPLCRWVCHVPWCTTRTNPFLPTSSSMIYMIQCIYQLLLIDRKLCADGCCLYRVALHTPSHSLPLTFFYIRSAWLSGL